MHLSTMFSSRIHMALATLGIALVSSVLVTAVLAKPVANTMQRNSLATTCATFSLSATAHKDTALDPERGIVSVLWYAGGEERHVDLPYAPKTKFAGCSASARSVLTEVQEVYTEQVRGLCTSFRDLLAGKTHLRPKNGRMPNIEGAKNYVKQYCQ